MSEQNDVTLCFEKEIMTLYHVGYVSEDIAKVLVLTHSSSELGILAVERYGSAVFRDPFDMKRGDLRFAEFSELLRIKEVRSGSIEVLLGCASLLSSIVVPLVVMRAQKLTGESELTLNVHCSHPAVQVLLNMYAAGDFGRGTAALNRLFSDLESAGIKVSALSSDVFVIDSIIERYARRIAKVIKIRRL